MFTANHFIWLAICIALISALLFVSLKFKFKFKTATYIICGISVASEICKFLTHMDPSKHGEGFFLRASSLPFHLCSIIIFMFFYLAISKKENEKLKVLLQQYLLLAECFLY